MKKILLILAVFFLLSFADKLWTEMRGWYKYNRIAFFSRQPSGSADSLGVYSQVQVDSIAGTLGGTIDATPTNGSTNAVQSDGVFDALALKSPLASPTFTGTPAAPTASAGTNTTQIATMAALQTAAGYLQTVISATGSATLTQVKYNLVTIDPPSTIATCALTTPASPNGGDIIKFAAGGTIGISSSVVTTFTLTANSGQSIYGAPTTPLLGGDAMEYIYDSFHTRWFRVK